MSEWSGLLIRRNSELVDLTNVPFNLINTICSVQQRLTSNKIKSLGIQRNFIAGGNI